MSADLLAAEAPQTAPSELLRTEAYYRLKADMEDFLYAEADLLDERRFRDWLNLLAEDITYFMPIRRNVSSVSMPSGRTPFRGRESAGLTRTNGRLPSAWIKS